MPSGCAVTAPSTAAGSRQGGRRVQEPALREAGAGHCGQAQGGRLDAEAAGFDRGDERGLVDADAADSAGVLHRGDPGSRAIMPGAATGSSAVSPERACPLVTVSRLVPSAGDLGQQRGGGGGGQAQDGDDRRDADRDAQRGQPGAQLAGPQPGAGEGGQVRGPQPGRGRRGRGGAAAAMWWS